MNNNINKSIIIIVVIFISLFIGVTWGNATLRSNYADTLDTCKRSQKVNAHDLEQLCGEMQDYNNFEFLCDDYGCWLEVK